MRVPDKSSSAKSPSPEGAHPERDPANLPPLDAVPPVPPPLAENIVYERLAADKPAAAEASPTGEAGTAITADEVEKVGEALLEAADVEPEADTELDRELRHEHKDLAGHTFAQSIGQVLENIHQRTIQAHQNFQKSPDEPAAEPGWRDKLPRLNWSKLPLIAGLPPLYRRAVVSGIGSGLAVAVAWLVVSWL